MESSDTPAEIESTPGQRLREARESAGMSPREMADRLNWLPAHVAAIEEDRYDQLKGAAFIRGYLRAYARAVELDEDEMVALYVALNPEAESPAAQAQPAPPTSDPGQTTGMSVVLGVAVAALVIVAVWWKQQGAEDDAPAASPAATAAPQQPAVAAREVAAPEAGEQAAIAQQTTTAAEPDEAEPETVTEEASPEIAATQDVTSDPPAPAAREPENTSSVQSASVAAPDALESTEQAPVPQAAAATPIEGVLQFSFSGDCWLEVRDGDGQLIYADLRRAGDSLGLDGVPPFEILAGDAAAVSLSYQGEPVVIRTRPGRDTARFTVGVP